MRDETEGVKAPVGGEGEEAEGSLHSTNPPQPQPRWSPGGVSAHEESQRQIIYQREIWIAFGCNLHFAFILFLKYNQFP